MTNKEIQKWVRDLASSDSAKKKNALKHILRLRKKLVPYLLQAFLKAKKETQRSSLAFYALKYARVSEEAFQLGLAACKDKGFYVRFGGFQILAYSLRREALPTLRKLLKHPDKTTRGNARATIDCIRRQNHHYFLDRTHAGRVFWGVNKGDSPLYPKKK